MRFNIGSKKTDTCAKYISAIDTCEERHFNFMVSDNKFGLIISHRYCYLVFEGAKADIEVKMKNQEGGCVIFELFHHGMSFMQRKKPAFFGGA